MSEHGVLWVIYSRAGRHAGSNVGQQAGRNEQQSLAHRTGTDNAPFSYCNGRRLLSPAVEFAISAAAAHCYRRSLEINPGNAVAHNNLGLVLAAAGDLNAAVASYLQALERRPDYAAAHGNLADTWRGLGDLDRALACCMRAVEIEPSRPEPHRNLAVVYRDRGDTDAALAAFRRALDLNPEYHDAAQGIGEVLLETGRHAEGLEVLSKAFGVIRFDARSGVSVQSGGRA